MGLAAVVVLLTKLFGPVLVHGGREGEGGPPAYVNPYQLLREEEAVRAQAGDPMVPLRPGVPAFDGGLPDPVDYPPPPMEGREQASEDAGAGASPDGPQ